MLIPEKENWTEQWITDPQSYAHKICVTWIFTWITLLSTLYKLHINSFILWAEKLWYYPSSLVPWHHLRLRHWGDPEDFAAYVTTRFVDCRRTAAAVSHGCQVGNLKDQRLHQLASVSWTMLAFRVTCFKSCERWREWYQSAEVMQTSVEITCKLRTIKFARIRHFLVCYSSNTRSESWYRHEREAA
jgi:hypothetical protein